MYSLHVCKRVGVVTIIPVPPPALLIPDCLNGTVIDISTTMWNEPALGMGKFCLTLIMLMIIRSLVVTSIRHDISQHVGTDLYFLRAGSYSFADILVSRSRPTLTISSVVGICEHFNVIGGS